MSILVLSLYMLFMLVLNEALSILGLVVMVYWHCGSFVLNSKEDVPYHLALSVGIGPNPE